MLFIAENNPKSEQLAENYGFTRRQAQIYLKEFEQIASSLIQSSIR